MQPQSSRVDFLSQVFATRGMSPDAANALSCDLVIHHSWTGRLGIDALARVLRDQGMDRSTARDTALSLLALEIFDHGAPFGEALKELEKWQREPGEALAAALEGSRIVRDSRSGDPESDRVKSRMIFALNWIAVASLAAAVVLAIFGG